MPDPNEELDIFDSATEAEDDAPPPSESSEPEVAVPNAAADQLVSSMISSMQREGGGPAARRFVPAVRTDRPPAESRQHQPGQQSNLPPDVQGVLAELREERKARQALERELRESRNPRQPEVPFSEQVFQDPERSIDGRVQQHLTPIAQQFETFRTDMDFRVSRIAHGEEFDAAYQEWYAQVGDMSRPDPNSYWAVMASPSPGEALMQWYEQRQIQKEAGSGGLKGFREKVRREVMQELGLEVGDEPPPARSNGRGNGHDRGRDDNRAPNGQFTPRHEVRLPTATSRMGHTARGAAYSPEDGSEEAIFDFGRARPERR